MSRYLIHYARPGNFTPRHAEDRSQRHGLRPPSCRPLVRWRVPSFVVASLFAESRPSYKYATMFVRFRETAYRLQVSLVETRRVDGKVRHEHVASLGSIATPQTVAGRVTFWARLHERLARLGNRLDGAAQGKALGAVHARIPMVTPDEQRALQLENAKADAGQWDRLYGMHVATAEDHKGLAATVASTIAKVEGHAAEAASNAKAARGRVERIERGENVEGGLGKPLSYDDMVAILHKAGLTDDDIRYSQQLAQFSEDELDALMPEIMKHKGRVERAVVRAALRRRAAGADIT
jgi:hypothetical protein